MSELKPCPFCGSKEVRQVEGDEYSWCMNPSCAIYDYEIRINEWNMRAESIELTTLREQVKMLREAQKSSIQADLNDVPEINFGDNPCAGCGTQRCYPEHCDMYEAKQKDGE